MRTWYQIPVLVILVLAGRPVYAGFYGGVDIETSTNMLLRPDGPSGVWVSMSGGANRSFGGMQLSYDVSGGMLERYKGIQYHVHQLSAQYLLSTESGSQYAAGFSGRIARYGDVSIFDGYNDIAGWMNGKMYLTPSLLLRWQGRINHRRYDPYDRENATDYDTYVRFDRFFASGTTLRGQLEGGLRQYAGEEDSRRYFIGGVRLRAARSLGVRWGAWIEGYLQKLSDNENLSSATQVDRVFLDDRFTYSSTGAAIHIKHVFPNGSVELATEYDVRDYPGGIASTYWYLPVDGWDEHEWAFSLHFTSQPEFLPSTVHPAVLLYYTNVNASVGALSYRAAGVSLSFTLY